jgi:hypothetical protein
MICLARMGVNPFDIQLRAANSSNSEPVFLTRGRLRIVIIKPYKYLLSGYVERFRKGFMPNSTVTHVGNLTPRNMDGVALEVDSEASAWDYSIGFVVIGACIRCRAALAESRWMVRVIKGSCVCPETV